MFDAIKAIGAGLKITNPVGRNPLRYALRNHKKLLVMDDVVWLGGINFSDHNFARHDTTMRVEDAAVADWFAAQFKRDWQGSGGSEAVTLAGIDLLSVDGGANEAAFQPLFHAFAGTRHTIDVISAYPTFPFVVALAAAAGRGVDVALYTPRANNKPIIRDYLLGVAQSSGLAIRLLPEMSHVKAVLIDGEALVVGSCNFDFVSYRANAEYVATIRDAGLIAEFTQRLLEPARAMAFAPSAGDFSRWRSFKARLGLRVADTVVSLLEPGQRVAEWRSA